MRAQSPVRVPVSNKRLTRFAATGALDLPPTKQADHHTTPQPAPSPHLITTRPHQTLSHLTPHSARFSISTGGDRRGDGTALVVLCECVQTVRHAHA